MTKSLAILMLALTSLFAPRAEAGQIIPSTFDLAKVPKAPERLYGQTITVDTRDPRTCATIRTELVKKHARAELGDLCAKDRERPYATVVTYSRRPYGPIEEVSGTIATFDSKHVNNSRNIVLLGAAGIARYFLDGKGPEHWQNPERRSAVDRWNRNLERGPVFDGDDFRTNYIEHPLAGSVYYTIARHDGFSALESFGFSVFASTFIWEFGLENVFEPASINDLVITPVVGSVLGEVFYQVHQSIEHNDGRVLGSPALGSLLQVVTNPGPYLSQGLDELLGDDWFDSAEFGWVVTRRAHPGTFSASDPYASSNALMLRLKLKFRTTR